MKRWHLGGQWRGGVWVVSGEVMFGLTIERWSLEKCKVASDKGTLVCEGVVAE